MVGRLFEIMEMYLHEAKTYLYDNYKLHLFFKKPFTWMDMPLTQARGLIARFLNRENTASIICFENKDCGDHWSMIKKCPFPLNKFKLLDSYFYPHLDVHKCGWSKDKNCSYIPREGIIFIKICSEK